MRKRQCRREAVDSSWEQTNTAARIGLKNRVELKKHRASQSQRCVKAPASPGGTRENRPHATPDLFAGVKRALSQPRSTDNNRSRHQIKEWRGWQQFR